MTAAEQALTRRPSRISLSRVVIAVAFVGGIGIGIAAGRGLAGSESVGLGAGSVGAAPKQAVEVAGLAAYRTTQASLRAALARNDSPTAAHFRAQLDTLRTPAITSALAHERVDLELGLAAATTWHDPRMAAEFRSRLATEAR